MTNPLEDAIIELANSDSFDETKRRWLAAVREHPETTDADYAAAEAILRDDRLTGVEADVSNLVELGFVFASLDGTYTTILPA